ncbi:MAG: phytoene dehydrogenase, partial [Nitrospinaceae bacterium]|nr:phytoene dehydrogenase [Nitrospinaceae bacterium]NIR56461.1 phytoene dehydrogenase [Nitrospinaceae bacterium]NIS86922.1 phytoene dehydrogenase [Nitrospinaceae bacterium]NIT83760.1 phytoene dehydrogenase [Nitrospinaceae bacterium]NIU45963.1 phytoene dehydrogenase [Nitrospinaceae bacterium]
PAKTYGIVFSNFMDKGVFTYRGGTDQLIKKMKKELQHNGVDIRTHCLAEKVYVEDGAVRGVRINGRDIG